MLGRGTKRVVRELADHSINFQVPIFNNTAAMKKQQIEVILVVSVRWWGFQSICYIWPIKRKSWISPQTGFYPTFFLNHYASQHLPFSFTWTFVNSFSPEINCWTSSFVGSGNSIFLRVFLPMFTTFGWHRLMCSSMVSKSNCIKPVPCQVFVHFATSLLVFMENM